MSKMMSSSCLRLVAKLDERDQDAILTRLDQLQAEGVPAERAQIQAAIDVLTGLKKMAIPEDKDLDPDNPDIKRSAGRNPMGFFSALARGIEAMPTKQAPAGAWKTQIKGLVNKGIVKQDEIEWSGIDDWLDLQDGKVSKEAVAEYLKQGGVKVEEVVLGDDDAEERARIAYYTSQRELMESAKELKSIIPKDLPANARANLVAWVYSSANGDEYAQDEIDKLELSGDVKNGIRRHMALAVAHDLASRKFSDSEPSKYGDYTIPGGENYREVLLILPSKNPVLGMSSMRASRILFGQRYDSLTESQKSELRRKVSGKDDPEPYRSGHWDQSNVIAHIRVNDRTDADGKRVLFVEELQSDWQADNRKAKDAIKAAVEDDFHGIVDRMKKAGVLEVNCD